MRGRVPEKSKRTGKRINQEWSKVKKWTKDRGKHTPSQAKN